MHKKILSAILALGMVMSISTTALANPTSDLQSKQSDLQKSQSSLNQVNKDSASLEGKIQELDSKIEGVMREIGGVDEKIAATQVNIKTSEKNLKKSEDDIKSEQDLYNRRMRALYISGDNGYIGVILQSKGISDFISRVENVRTIAKFDNNIIKELKSKKEVVQEKRQALATQNSKLVALQADNRKKLDDINKSKASQSVLLAQLNVQKEALGEKIALSNDQIRAMKQKTDAAAGYNRPTTSSGTINRGGNSLAGSTSSIIQYAGKFLGVKYVYGGESPDGFDCSGLVQYVYGNNGISLPRVTTDQVNSGTKVSGDLQPGDLVFFGDPSAPHHVGIYIGGGQMIHAPHTGDVVRVADVGNYCAARRVK